MFAMITNSGSRGSDPLLPQYTSQSQSSSTKSSVSGGNISGASAPSSSSSTDDTPETYQIRIHMKHYDENAPTDAEEEHGGSENNFTTSRGTIESLVTKLPTECLSYIQDYLAGTGAGTTMTKNGTWGWNLPWQSLGVPGGRSSFFFPEAAAAAMDEIAAEAGGRGGLGGKPY